MDLTIEQTLQQGLAAHKEGKLQEAERLYRAILQTQPAHPDANYNLGVLAASLNQPEAALPLFKTALEANPKIERFWISYIDTLIKEHQFETAKLVLADGEKAGLDRDKLDALSQQLLSASNDASPSQSQINTLLEHYQNGQYGEAERLAVSMTKQFPNHQFSWKVLGAVLKQTGRLSESLGTSQKSVELAPQDAEAHYNLSITLKELGRLEEAEASRKQAIALKPDFAEAHSNLGNTLKDLGRLEEAEASYRQAITLKTDYAEAHNNLGITLQEMGRLEEAEASCKQAIALKSNYAEAHYTLGITLKALGRLNEAEASFKQAIVLKADYAEAYNNLGATLQELDRLKEAEASYKQAIALKSNYAEAHFNLGLLFYSAKEYEKALEQFKLSNFEKSKNYLLRCLYEQGEQTLFFDQLDYLINQGEVHPMIGSLGCRSTLKYGVERPNLFCRDPLKYVLEVDLINQYDFENVFVNTIRTILNLNRAPDRKQGLLINGYQTFGNLFELERDVTEEIQNIIRLEIEKYHVKFKDSEEGLITNWPADYSLNGWLICMKSGGELRPHMHEKGWISGTVYINVPSKSEPDSGNLVVSIGEEKDATGPRRNTKKILDVVTGSLIFFPASLTHYTIPFESEEERICIAFDVIPK